MADDSPFAAEYAASQAVPQQTTQAPVVEASPFAAEYAASQVTAPSSAPGMQYSFAPSAAGTESDQANAQSILPAEKIANDEANPIMNPGPYDPSQQLKPSAYIENVQPGSFPNDDVHKPHLANALLTSAPEKLSYLQANYPDQDFGVDDLNNIIYSSDKGKTWNQFEGWSNPANKLATEGTNLLTTGLEAGGATLGAPAGGVGAIGGAMAGAQTALSAKRGLAKLMGMTPDWFTTQSEKQSLGGAAIAQTAANSINPILGDALAFRAGAGDLNDSITSSLLDAEGNAIKYPASAPLKGNLTGSLSRALQENTPAKSLKNTLSFTPPVNTGFSPLVTGPQNPLRGRIYNALFNGAKGSTIEPALSIATKAAALPVGAGAGILAGLKSANPLVGAGVGVATGEGVYKTAQPLSKLLANIISSPVYNPTAWVTNPIMNNAADAAINQQSK